MDLLLVPLGKLEVGGVIASESEAELEAPIGAAALRQAVE